MAFGDRKSERVDFDKGIHVYIMGIDGTWRRDCLMIDVSQTGARLSVEGSLEGLDLKEFFLLLSSTGLPIAGADWCGLPAIKSGRLFETTITQEEVIRENCGSTDMKPIVKRDCGGAARNPAG